MNNQLFLHPMHTFNLIIENCSHYGFVEKLIPHAKKASLDFYKKYIIPRNNIKRDIREIIIETEINLEKHISDQLSKSFLEQMNEDDYINNLEKNVKKITQYEAVSIFKPALKKICYDKLKNNEDVNKFNKLNKIIYSKDNSVDIEKIKQIPIKQVLDYLKVEHKKGFIYENGKITSAHIYEEKNIITRFSGKKGGGDVIDIVQHYNNCTFKEATNFLNNFIF